MIYVVQTLAGYEAKVARWIAILPSNLDGEGRPQWDAFVPTRLLQRRRGGVWRTETDVLFPGYVFVKAAEGEGLRRSIYSIPNAIRLLGRTERGVLALTETEEAIVGALIGEQGKAMGMSVGIVDGDRVVVHQGPLKGMESIISKIDRHKRVAWIDVSICGRNVPVKVGLEIVAKKDPGIRRRKA